MYCDMCGQLITDDPFSYFAFYNYYVYFCSKECDVMWCEQNPIDIVLE